MNTKELELERLSLPELSELYGDLHAQLSYRQIRGETLLPAEAQLLAALNERLDQLTERPSRHLAEVTASIEKIRRLLSEDEG